MGTPANAAEAEPYLAVARPLFGRVISGVDAEITSPSRGSFDRTWWCWKFTDFSAPRFQEGAHVLAWLATSPLSPPQTKGNSRLFDLACSSIGFWTRLQHRDGSFDEAYPYERSLAATAFTGFYVGIAIERIRQHMPSRELAQSLSVVERGARWLAANGEYHGILSNHLAAAAGALQVAGDLLGSDKFRAARDRYLGIIYREQHHDEGWMTEYGGADPGYQSHGMFYLAEIARRTGDEELYERLSRATDFMAWFVHPDGTVGGEYASRGTKFAYPAAFEMMASRNCVAASIAAHMRERLVAGRGVSATEMDVWNQFPMINNLLFAADAAGSLPTAAELPWRKPGARARFVEAGLAVANAGGLVVSIGGRMGGALKAWSVDGRLQYEDCGYALPSGEAWAVSQGESTCSLTEEEDRLVVEVEARFRKVKGVRFDPWRFVAFRGFTTTVGRFPMVSRWLKDILVAVLIRHRRAHRARLMRRIVVSPSSLTIFDRIADATERPIANARHVAFHMGSSRYADLDDWLGAVQACPAPEGGPSAYTRVVEIRAHDATQ